MLVLLPPSETKRPGDAGPVLDLATLSFPELAKVRRKTVSAVVRLGRTPRTAARVLELGPGQRAEIEWDAALREAPTRPAVELYTGVLYDALDVASFDPEARGRVSARIAIGSALFGLVRADDHIPAYRLSSGTVVPALGSLVRLWKPVLGPLLAGAVEAGLVVDLRSGGYRALGPAPGSVDVRVLTERPDGARSVVSHFNKSTKGLVARLLVQAEAACTDASQVAEVLRAGGLEVEQAEPLRLDVITRA